MSTESWLSGRYELQNLIGRGGMADVWRARDHRLGRDVAVKRLRADLASDDTFQARFQREAQSAARLNHPNIVAVYDTGETQDPTTGLQVPYIVMELIDGHTLRDVLRDGRKILPRRALEFTQGVLDALSYSHAAGIVHRDIKPANVMLTREGYVKVMDFGIARAVADTSATMTQTAAVIGTAQYLSPEQARGETVDNRADIYATGCLLYELLVGRPPFIGDSPVSVAYQHVREIPAPPSSLDSEITGEMDAITLKALAKERADRYQTAKQMRDDIDRLLSGREPLAMQAHADPDADTEEQTHLIPAAAATAAAPPAAPAAAAQRDEATPAQTESPAEPEEPKRKRWPVVLVTILVVALLALLGFGLHRILGPSSAPTSSPTPSKTVKMVDVPAVTGLSQQGATSTLENAGLKVKVEHVQKDESTANQVVSQNPAANQKVPEGSKVTITVNDGPKKLTIPQNIVGMPKSDAVKALKDAGFSDNQIRVNDDDPKTEANTAKAGTVDSVRPSAGTSLTPEQQVTLTVATGKSVVPNLKGMSVEEAYAAASSNGFSISVERQTTSSAAPGTVFSQDPDYGATAKRSTAIKVLVAVKPSEPTHEAPTSPTPSEDDPSPVPTSTASPSSSHG
ncbi:Stk1 family PASTA domain-containing Ser/Thr kinase [Cutibacterium avidum]|uniref:Stk1 family PASTA domain-containing Ser/Thr kinase n=1 Tax=Cutibacterium avidum TaxID=33010 RepID=UPI000BFD0FB1|nr:Stk1 family PASTA domain-containing Ser/Thr kinase [Cutibacterium avidum]MCO6670827.1 Stk1 family PASTA domain-containing Ser/Thr kinase [Cutibacterium avidum]PGX67815.1 serine/threonine protein kinase [Cutibacterium avidum]PGX71178.1 serine/threonine protein kinase [Cutibacterium avidum]